MEEQEQPDLPPGPNHQQRLCGGKVLHARRGHGHIPVRGRGRGRHRGVDQVLLLSEEEIVFFLLSHVMATK